MGSAFLGSVKATPLVYLAVVCGKPIRRFVKVIFLEPHAVGGTNFGRSGQISRTPNFRFDKSPAVYRFDSESSTLWFCIIYGLTRRLCILVFKFVGCLSRQDPDMCLLSKRLVMKYSSAAVFRHIFFRIRVTGKSSFVARMSRGRRS